uniref:Uncharacterized protein n=1 Tax=viral metagenome TaxID=1070528 RepID=A0A6C0BMM2_9ZZZZ
MLDSHDIDSNSPGITGLMSSVSGILVQLSIQCISLRVLSLSLSSILELYDLPLPSP